MEMKLFRMDFDETSTEELGVYALSIVNDPAIKSNYIALADENLHLHLKVQDAKKHTLTGAVLIPNKPIVRKNKETGELFQVYFTTDTVEKASQEFMKKFYQSSITAEHLVTVDDVTVTETWLKSSEVDKSVDLGLDVPIGSWLVTLKVENTTLWDSFIETGLLNGFSIEGFFKPTEVTATELSLSNENQTYMKANEKSIITKIKELVGVDQPEKVELEAVAEVSDLWWKDVLDGTVFSIGNQVMRKPYDDKESPYPLNAGEYVTEDGKKILVDSKGIIRWMEEPVAMQEVKASAEVTEVTEAPVEDKVEVQEEVKPEAEPTLEDVAKQVEKKVEEEVPMIAHTDVGRPSKAPKLKFNGKLTVQERIKAQLEANKPFVKVTNN